MIRATGRDISLMGPARAASIARCRFVLPLCRDLSKDHSIRRSLFLHGRSYAMTSIVMVGLLPPTAVPPGG